MVFIAVLNIFTIFNKVIIGLLLFFKRNNSLPNKVLALSFFLPALIILSNFLLLIGDYRFGSLIFICQMGVHIMSASIYIYCRLMMGAVLKVNGRLLLYFISALIPLACWLYYIFLYTEAEKFELQKNSFSNPDLLLYIMNIAGPIVYIFYMSLSLYKVRRFNKIIDNVYSEIEKVKIIWLNQFTGLMLALGVLMSLSYFLFSHENVELIIIPILSNIIYFYIIYQGFNNSVLFSQREYIQFQEKLYPANQVMEEKYKKSTLSDEEIKSFGQQIISVMTQDKLFLNPELTINDLSLKINLSSNKTSEIINRQFNKNFFDFVNSYRVEHAKQCLLDPSYNSWVLEAIGEESGFGSKAAFNRAFKKSTGLTPGQFKKSYQSKESSSLMQS